MELILKDLARNLVGSLRRQTAGNIRPSSKKPEDFLALYRDERFYHQLTEGTGLNHPVRYAQTGMHGELEVFVIPITPKVVIYAIYNRDTPISAGCVAPPDMKEPPVEWTKFQLLFESMRIKM
jgi:hypothetical protein